MAVMGIKVEISEEGVVYCDGFVCNLVPETQYMCDKCPLKEVVEKCYAACDPLTCRKIRCAGCSERLIVQGVKDVIERYEDM